MKNLCYLAIVLLSVCLIIHGCGGSEDSAKSDQQILQGTWVGTATGMDVEYTMTISGSNFDMKTEDSTIWYKGTFVLNDKVTPKQGDFKINDCGIEQYVGKTVKSIYKIENDTLTIAANEPGTETIPADFVANELTQVFTLKRK
jgi:uncharacterized protein (TIGR03067 family)